MSNSPEAKQHPDPVQFNLGLTPSMLDQMHAIKEQLDTATQNGIPVVTIVKSGPQRSVEGLFTQFNDPATFDSTDGSHHIGRFVELEGDVSIANKSSVLLMQHAARSIGMATSSIRRIDDIAGFRARIPNPEELPVMPTRTDKSWLNGNGEIITREQADAICAAHYLAQNKAVYETPGVLAFMAVRVLRQALEENALIVPNGLETPTLVASFIRQVGSSFGFIVDTFHKQPDGSMRAGILGVEPGYNAKNTIFTQPGPNGPELTAQAKAYLAPNYTQRDLGSVALTEQS